MRCGGLAGFLLGRPMRCYASPAPPVPLGTRTGPVGCNLHCPRAGIISVARGDFISIVLSHND